MKLLSNDLKHEEIIDRKFTCDGEDFSPHLKWMEYPKETKSFAISCIDIDADLGLWSHWYLYDIPPEITEVDQDGSIPGKILENDFGNRYYNGPCSGDKHRYVFKVHALNIETLEKLPPG